jgi:ankyrin repeat protein
MLRATVFDFNNIKSWLKKESNDGFTALHYAAFQNNPKTIEILLAYGANVH